MPLSYRMTTEPIETIKQIASDIVSPAKTAGEELKSQLGLDKFQNIYIQKVINSSLPVYIITVDSRRPTLHLTNSKLKSVQSTYLRRYLDRGGSVTLNDFKLSPSFDLESYTGIIPSRSIIIFRDLGGEYRRNPMFYNESTSPIKYRFYRKIGTILERF